MKITLVIIFLFLIPLLTSAQIGEASFYMPILGKNLSLKFNKHYYFSLNQTGMKKLTLLNGQSQHRFMKIINQVGDTLIFEEGKLFKEDIDSVLYVNPKRYMFVSITGYIYLPFAITYTLLSPGNKVYLYLIIPPITAVSVILLSRVKQKFVNLKDYELIPQNILGKDSKNGW